MAAYISSVTTRWIQLPGEERDDYLPPPYQVSCVPDDIVVHDLERRRGGTLGDNSFELGLTLYFAELEYSESDILFRVIEPVQCSLSDTSFGSYV
jgi:hypothetical protein